MVSLARKLSKAVAFGFALGFTLFILGSLGLAIVSSLPTTTPSIGFAIGFGCSIAATLSDDETDNEKAISTKT